MNTRRFRQLKPLGKPVTATPDGSARHRPRAARGGHRTLLGLAALSVATGTAMLTLVPAGAAQAAGGCTARISVPNVSVTQSSPGMFRWVQASLVQGCGASSAQWDAYYNTPSTSNKEGSWDFGQNRVASWPLPFGSGPIGTYEALPAGAVGDGGTPVPQATTYFAIKFGSRTRIGGYRSGNWVNVRAHASRFNWSRNGGYGAWQQSAGRSVNFYDWRNGRWFRDQNQITGPNGWTPYLRIYAPTQRSFHAHASQTPSFWGALSSNIDR